MKKAFYYMFKDTETFKKTYILLLFLLASNLVINFSNILHTFIPVLNTNWQDSMFDPIWNWVYVLLSFVSITLMFIPNGYALSLIKSLSNQENNFILPEMNMKQNFLKGLKVAVGFGLIYLLFVVVASLFLTASAIITIAFSNQILLSLTAVMILITLLVFLFYFPIFNFMFAYKSNLLTFFRYMMATKIFTIDKKLYFKGVSIFAGIFLFTMLFTSLLSSIPVLRNPFLFAISTISISLLTYYFMLVESFIIAKSIKLQALEVIGIVNKD